MEPHDVFISYAREDSEWVRNCVYEPLAACRTQHGRPARIFFDVGEHGIEPGTDFQTEIENAIEITRKFVPIYSNYYFKKEMCLLELKMARQRDVSFSNRLLLPLLKDAAAAQMVPFGFKTLNWLSVDDPNWFARICSSLDLALSADRVQIVFLNQPGNVFANHTLPRIQVKVKSGHVPLGFEERVTIKAEHARLLGTTATFTEQGLATFDDLSIPDAVNETRLIVQLTSSPTQTVSEPFAVLPAVQSSASGWEDETEDSSIEPQRVPIRTVDRESAPVDIVHNLGKIPHGGTPLFFSFGEAVAVFQEREVSVYRLDGTRMSSRPLSLHGAARLIRRSNQRILLCDWQGNVQVVQSDGSGFDVRIEEANRTTLIPADAAIVDDAIYIGFWNGHIYRLSSNGTYQLHLRETDGVQALEVSGDRMFVCDFSGNLRTYRNRRLLNTVRFPEPAAPRTIGKHLIWSLKETSDGFVAVGNRQMYQISANGSAIYDFDLPLGEVESVYDLSAWPVVMDTEGKGIQFDAKLVIKSRVRTQPGAYAVSADDHGAYCILFNPDGTYTLLHKGRIVFGTSEGELAVSPDGTHFAMGHRDLIDLLPQCEFWKLVESQSPSSSN